MTDEADRPVDGADAANGTVRAQYEWASVPPSTAVIETVAVAVNRGPAAIEPLYGVVDPDALDALFRSSKAATDADPVTVSFDFAKRQVTVSSTGNVIVRPIGLDG